MTMRKSRSVAAATVVFGFIGAARAEVGVPVPAATAIMGTTLCVVDGWEYAPRWSVPNNGFVSPSLEDCAAQCEADAVCTGATFIVEGSKTNCWFKDWGAGPAAHPCLPDPTKPLKYQAIIDPAGATCATITYMNEPVYDCEVEKLIDEKPSAMGPALVPAAAAASTVTDPAELALLTPPYAAYPGVDYSPIQEPPPAVPITDVGTGMVVDDAVACATACTAEPLCTAASYYGDNPAAAWPGGKNCYLKTLTGCVLPADVVVMPDNTIFLIGGLDCADAPLPGIIAAPPLGAAPPAGLFAPIAPTASPLRFAPVPGGVPPLSSEPDVVGTDSNRAFGAPAPTDGAASSESGSGTPTVTATTPSGSKQALPSLAATAVLGAALLL